MNTRDTQANLPIGSRPVLVVIAGPSGSGKGTLKDRLISENIGFSKVVTATTRAPRVGQNEVDGIHYHFLKYDEFRRRIRAKEWLEWAYVHGNTPDRLYGTPKSSVLGPLERGQSLVMDINVKGVDSLRKLALDNALIHEALVTVFMRVKPVLMIRRIRARSTISESDLAARLESARVEELEIPKFDFVIDSNTKDEDYYSLFHFLEQSNRIPKTQAA